MSIPITKEALIERGFWNNPGSWWYKYEKGLSEDINVHFPPKGVFSVELSSVEGIESITVPNCRTMEQLDQLISLFTRHE